MRKIVLACLLSTLATVPALRAEPVKEAPVPIRTVAPEYPKELRAEGVSGIVKVSFTVDAQGAVKDPTVENATNAAFINPALKAVAQWKFKPGRVGGQPADMKLSLPIYFSLEG